ncbi:1-acyl-sn-glycerol-3-phosphate acyltransferase [Moraxella caviae]|uniref:1-acyl-sn-glycerol-3-phosphate acyltransferase n=1 Tax=Moraxella caviae TaxID=34060 RepID=A0A1T0A0Z4_9GAMM|nr:lysophospholipid acyltransferase family protein [Moraxella caviae]OOR89436.1 1-acyl-sn-glycerol-3-phosphate acyltransferase [Moraxella caviae]STZ09840.1 1-acyl-sn-glycerol-3-phosphate acyltransferase [Moraxella caviae]
MANFISTQYRRARSVAGMSSTLVGGFKKAYQVGAFRGDLPREALPKYIQVFCRKMANSFGVRVVQVEPVPQRHGLWASNHVSWLDIPVVGSVAPVFFLSKAEISKWPIFGRLATAAGTLFIQRGSGDAGSVSDQIAKFLQDGSSVVFFPEATTTDGKAIKKVHGKLLQASMDTGLPICPMVVAYVDKDGRLSDDAAYYGERTMAESLKRVMDNGGITAYVLALEPIEPADKTRSELTQILQERMEQGLAKLHSQVVKA